MRLGVFCTSLVRTKGLSCLAALQKNTVLFRGVEMNLKGCPPDSQQNVVCPVGSRKYRLDKRNWIVEVYSMRSWIIFGSTKCEVV